MICDLCGVKVTTPEARRQRFGHVNLSTSVAHPLGEGGERLSAVPVLPAVFWQAPGGVQLAQRYDALALVITSASDGVSNWTAEKAEQLLTPEVVRLFELLLPVAIFTHEWDLSDSQTIAHGLALESRADGG
jgi:hypothetical protein